MHSYVWHDSSFATLVVLELRAFNHSCMWKWMRHASCPCLNIHWNRLEQTATDCNRLRHSKHSWGMPHVPTSIYTGTDCNRLQQTATDWDTVNTLEACLMSLPQYTLEQTATDSNRLRHGKHLWGMPHVPASIYTGTDWNRLQQTATDWDTVNTFEACLMSLPQYTLEQTAIDCNRLQQTTTR